MARKDGTEIRALKLQENRCGLFLQGGFVTVSPEQGEPGNLGMQRLLSEAEAVGHLAGGKLWNEAAC